MAGKRRNDTHILHLRAASIALGAGIALLTLLAAGSAAAQTFTTLHSFHNTDGNTPYSVLVQATNGNLYGTTAWGGAYNAGTVFEMTPSGAIKPLYSFCSQSGCPDGENPTGTLVQATDGNFYGTTSESGANGQGGAVFKITPSGTLTTLYSFCSQSGCTDGENPTAGLIQATNGNLYGTTVYGGTYNSGSVFKITLSGTFTLLHSFSGDQADGANPIGGLVQATNGNFYGMTEWGGVAGAGTVFEITATGTLTTLYSFCSQGGCRDGEAPDGGLVQAPDGELYGMTNNGGANGEGGTVFRITPSGKLTTLYSFCSLTDCADGARPYAALIQATDGNFYGTTSWGGAKNVGSVLKITPSGTLTTLYSFCSQNSCIDGASPATTLVQDTNGNLYGTTLGGGGGYGTVFSLSMGLAPFVETLPAFGAVGKAVKILGTNLTGATSVTFNGIPAVFTVVSPSLIGTTVPAGATTGTVQVVTPSGTLNSNVPFRVRQ